MNTKIVNQLINLNDEYEKILVKQKDNIISQKERLSLEKYIYAKVFNVDQDDIDKAFMKTQYGKLDIFYNNKAFICY